MDEFLLTVIVVLLLIKLAWMRRFWARVREIEITLDCLEQRLIHMIHADEMRSASHLSGDAPSSSGLDTRPSIGR